MRDAQQPTGKPPRRIEGVEAAKCLDECFLREVFGERRIPGEPTEQGQHGPFVPPHDLLERPFGPTEGLRDEPRLVDAVEIDLYDGRP